MQDCQSGDRYEQATNDGDEQKGNADYFKPEFHKKSKVIS